MVTMASSNAPGPRAYAGVLATLWGRNVTGGLVVGVLALATITENLMAAAWRWPGWPGAALGVVTLAWFVASLPVAMYQVWRKDQAALREAEEKLDSASEAHAPQFSASIREIQWSTERDDQDFWVILTILIRNTGADCGILGFSVFADARDGGGLVRPAPFDLTDGDLHLTLSDESMLVVKPQHLLLHRTDSVPRNRHVVGILPVRFEHVDGEGGPEFIDFLTLRVEFSDVRGVTWSTEAVTDRDVAGPVARAVYPTLPTP
jgi:hypothetical protein